MAAISTGRINPLPRPAVRLLDARVRIERFDSRDDTASLRACFAITDAAWAVDHPTAPPWGVRSFAGKWMDGFDSSPQQAWLGFGESGELAGGYLLQLPDKENLRRAGCTLIVALDKRRAGVGTELLAHCREQARQMGRTWLDATVRDGSPGAAFAAAAGASAGIAEVARVLSIDGGLPARLESLRASAEQRADGYTLVSWTGPTPDQHLDQVARVRNAMADAPRDAGVEAHTWDAERLRRSDQSFADYGLLCRSIGARHDKSGEMAALTQVGTDVEVPGWGFQMVTAVLPQHRGHRLGLLVKIAMLELLASQAPEVERIFTGNAGSNQHMIAINDQLGFVVADTYRSWELKLAGGTGPGQPAAV
jgi:GNAT superfamily N-acetyltransferase